MAEGQDDTNFVLFCFSFFSLRDMTMTASEQRGDMALPDMAFTAIDTISRRMRVFRLNKDGWNVFKHSISFHSI